MSERLQIVIGFQERIMEIRQKIQQLEETGSAWLANSRVDLQQQKVFQQKKTSR